MKIFIPKKMGTLHNYAVKMCDVYKPRSVVRTVKPRRFVRGRKRIKMRTGFGAESSRKLANWEKENNIRGKPEDGKLGCGRGRWTHCLSTMFDVRTGMDLRLIISEPG
jgi:hypothetical protein